MNVVRTLAPLAAAWLLAQAVVAAEPAADRRSSEPSRPNIVVILADDK